ncbi:MAG TPA: FtsX-like permease family protein [Myxococcota bacterium]|nr:FtsX-like permease family protein [Myxococcota bacterium]
MGGLASIAWRNLWRQRRRTLLTLVSIAFGGFLTIMMTALQDRSFADFIDNAARLGSGHVALQHPEYRDTPTLTRSVTDADEKRKVAEADPAADRAVERVTGQTMVSTASDSFGALFIAYDPALETPETLTFTRSVVEGRLFESADEPGIILGDRLARNLNAKIGNKVVYTLTDRSGEIVTGMQRLVGVVHTGAPSLDAGLCLLPIGAVQRLVGYAPHEATQVALFLHDGRQSLAAASRLDRHVGPNTAVLTWDEVQPEIRTFVAMKVGGSRVIEAIVALLVAAGIFNTLFMSVLERTREFGIMLAIGYEPRQLFALVMLESAYLAALGLAASLAITAWPYHRLSQTGIDMSKAYSEQGLDSLEISGVGMDPILRIGIFPDHAVAIVVTIAAATLLAGLYPAWKAGRVSPVESINLV